MKDIIHFSHANGFPASTYRTIFAELADDYEIRSVERFGHDPRYPVTRDWPHLVDQLLDDIAQRPLRRAAGTTESVARRPFARRLSVADGGDEAPAVGEGRRDARFAGDRRLAQQSPARVAVDGARRAPVARRRDEEPPHALGEPRRSVAALPLEARVRALGRAHAVRLHRFRDSANGRQRRAARSRSTATSSISSTGPCRARSARGSRAASRCRSGSSRGRNRRRCGKWGSS